MKLTILNDPFIKTFVSQTGGIILGAFMNALDTFLTNPSAGTSAYLVAHPIAFLGYNLGIGLVHNYISRAQVEKTIPASK